MKIEPFYNKTIEHRLALGLLAQPQSNNHKRNQSSPWLDAFCIIATAAMAGAFAWVILP
jgi:hypothetical protein